nr:hypothetical protein [uncultured Caproiciproducens sp.]
MNSPYCGWNKNISNDLAEASDHDFLEFEEKEKPQKNNSEINLYKNSIQIESNQSD